MSRPNVNQRRFNRRPLTIGRKLRQLGLTGQPSWYLVKSRQVDVPPYKEDVTYARKVRMIINVTSGAAIPITNGQIGQALFGGNNLPFTRMCVTEIQAWSSATADSFVRITPSLFTMQGDITGDKSFSDIGTVNSIRPHVHIKINAKDAAFITFASLNTNVVTMESTSGRTIVDFHCLFSGTAGAPQILSEG